MKNIAVIALLFVVLIGCTPVIPARNQTSAEPVVEELNVSVEPMTSENVTLEEVPTEVPEESTEPSVDLKDVPRKEVVEGDVVDFPNLKAVDPDGDPIKYTFTAPLNEKGVWATKEGDAGEHLISITATDGVNTVSQQVLIVVNAKNKPPIIELADPVEAVEGETFVLAPTITDPEGDAVNVTFDGWMTSESKAVSYNESGLKKVIITASDGKAVSKKEVIVSVKNTNRPPVFSDLSEISVKEGQKVKVNPKAKDPDGDSVSFTFEEPLDKDGVWTPAIGDAGDYELVVTASDGELTSEQVVKVVIEAV